MKKQMIDTHQIVQDYHYFRNMIYDKKVFSSIEASEEAGF